MGFIAGAISAVAGFIGVGAAAASVIGQVGALALTVGASLWLNSKNKTSSSVSGASTKTEMGGDLPRQIPFGTIATGGHLIYVNSYGKSNKYEQEVYALADVECDSLVGIIVDGEEKYLVPKDTLYSEDARFWVNDKDNNDGDDDNDANHYGSKLEIRFYRGAASQTADPGLINNSNPLGRWTSAHRGDGICYVVIDKTYDEDLFSGFPTFTFIVKGAKLYDPRKDSTAGGSGSHRWDTPSTWEWSENPAICLYNYQRGFYRGGTLFMGQGVPESDLPVDYYIAAANVCDESVTLLAGSEARYAVSAIANDDQTHATIIQSLVDAMAGYLYEQSGAFLPYAGAAQSVVTTITDDDLVLGSSVSVTRKRSRADLFNYLSGTFTSPDDLWDSKGCNPIKVVANETVDGERLGSSLDLPMITSQTRAERVMLVRYNEVRHQTNAVISLSLRNVALEVGDWIRWNSARYGDRVYRIDQWTLSPNGASKTLGVSLQLQGVATSIYGWTAEADQTTTIASGSGRTDSALTRSVSGFTVSPGSATSAAGESIPTLVCTWTPPDDDTVTSVIIQYRIEGTEGASQSVCSDPESGKHVISGIAGGADYEVRATITTDPSRSCSWVGWFDVTTNLTTIVAEAVIPEALAAQIAALSEQSATMRKDALAAALAVNTANATSATQIKEVEVRAVSIGEAVASRLTSFAAEVATTYATIEQVEVSAVSIGEAIASQVTSLAAEAATTYATIEQVDELEASVGDIVANTGVTFTAAADQTGAVARYDLNVNATDGTGSVATGGMQVVAISSGGTNISQIKMFADRFLVVDSSGNGAAAFSVVDSIPRFLGKIVIDPDVSGNAEILIRGP